VAAALPKSIVGVGDSIMNGYGAPSPLDTAVLALGTGAVRYNGGNPGERSNQIRDRWLATESTICGVRRCDYVWFEGGVNDLRLAGTPPATVAANMTTAVDDALSKGYVVLWSDILPCRADADCGASVGTNILAYNAVMQSACTARAGNTNLRCIFAYAAFDDPAQPGYLLAAYSRDGLHLSVSGSAALGAMAAARLP
jgi:lysophospholipase L1-like esterase